MTARPRQTARDKRESTFRYGSAAIISIGKTVCLHVPMRVSHHKGAQEKRTCWAPAISITISRQEIFIYFFVVRRILWNAAKGMPAILFWAFSISYRPAPSVPSTCTVRSTLLLPFIVLCDNPNFYCFLFFRSPYFLSSLYLGGLCCLLVYWSLIN